MRFQSICPIHSESLDGPSIIRCMILKRGERRIGNPDFGMVQILQSPLEVLSRIHFGVCRVDLFIKWAYQSQPTPRRFHSVLYPLAPM